MIDTNALLLLLGYQCLELENTRGPRRYQILNGIRGRSDNLPLERYERLWRVFQRVSRRIVTQHVVAETYGLRKLLKFPKDLIWRSAMKILTDPGLEEDACSIRELSQREEYKEILTDLGPTDTGLLHSAQRHKATLLTDDEPLVGWAHVRSVPVVSLIRIEDVVV